MGESSRLGSLRGVGVGGGEIVEVQGGHIVRSTGRKDRHSKVCTAKGPRDRRVRLAAHTAIQFYDVQDRLGYDRPSKAVDWLIKKAKAAIDELEELPAWHPTTGSTAIVNFEQQQENNQENSPLDSMVVGNNQENPNGNSSSFLPPSMDSDSIADTIKSFFPMGASTEANTSAMQQFQSFPPPDLLSRTSNHSQDLRLSLQSFQDPIMLHHHHNQQSHHFHNPSSHNEQEQQVQTGFFTGATPAQLSFDGSGWSEQHQNHHQQQQQPTEFNRFQRLSSWNPGGDTGGTSGGATPGGGGAGGGYLYNSASGPSLLQPFFGQNQFFSQRGPLQSSNTSSIRAWMDPSSAIAMANNTDHSHQNHQHHHQQQPMIFNYQPAISGIGFASGVGGFSDFRIPSRIQGDDEEHDGISDKPSSASSDSHH